MEQSKAVTRWGAGRWGLVDRRQGGGRDQSRRLKLLLFHGSALPAYSYSVSLHNLNQVVGFDSSKSASAAQHWPSPFRRRTGGLTTEAKPRPLRSNWNLRPLSEIQMLYIAEVLVWEKAGQEALGERTGEVTLYGIFVWNKCIATSNKCLTSSNKKRT